MKTFYPSEKVKKHYKIVGIASIFVAIIILLIAPLGKINSIQKIIFIIIIIALPTIYSTRIKRMVLTIDKEMLYFNDGLFSQTKIPLDMIKSIQYHPDLKFRVNLFKRNRTVTIMNVFTIEDQQEILKTIQAKRHRIEIEYLQKPEKIMVIEKDRKSHGGKLK